MIKARQSYYDERNSAKDKVNKFDGMRLFIFNMIQLAPFVFSMLGVSQVFGHYSRATA